MKELLRETYLEKLSEYCNKYDNIVILNEVKAFVGEQNITLSDVYADFELVSKEEYDRGNGKIGFDSGRAGSLTHFLNGLGDFRIIVDDSDEKTSDMFSNTPIDKADIIDHTIHGMVVLSEPVGG